jgi:hypothetical protein
MIELAPARRLFCIAFAALVLTACTGNVKTAGGERPAWIDNPGNGVSASAGMNVRGAAAQEALAILRAREEFAKRFGVNIQSAQMLSTTVRNGQSNTVGAGVAHEDTQQVDVKARVKAKWRDPRNDVLWVWLVPSGE